MVASGGLEADEGRGAAASASSAPTGAAAAAAPAVPSAGLAWPWCSDCAGVGAGAGTAMEAGGCGTGAGVATAAASAKADTMRMAEGMWWAVDDGEFSLSERRGGTGGSDAVASTVSLTPKEGEGVSEDLNMGEGEDGSPLSNLQPRAQDKPRNQAPRCGGKASEGRQAVVDRGGWRIKQ